MSSRSRRVRTWRLAAATGLSGVVALGLVAAAGTPATAADNVLRADAAVTRACHDKLLPAGTRGTDRRELTSGVDGLLQARLTPIGDTSGDWDLAVFDQKTGAVVAASAGLHATELAESFVTKGQQLVVQGCRYAGPAKTTRLGVDFLALDKTGQPTKPAQVVRVQTPTRQDKDRLLGLDLDLTEKGDATSVDVVIATDADRAKLAGSGLRSSVVEADLSGQSIANAKQDRAFAATATSSALPSGRTSYRHLYEYDYELKELARANPGLVKAFTLPEVTWEGREVNGIEIATDVDNTADGKAVNLTLGVHHAREWPSGEHAIEWAYELVKGYRAGGEIRSLVGKTRNIIVPVVNADGFSISREAEPKGDFSRFDYEMKRKNCNVNDSPAQYRTGVCKANPAGGSRGTDPNRNYAGFWGGNGASTLWNVDTYRGSAPFSEPETRNVRSLVSTRQITNLITLHTYSGLVLRVPGVADVRPPLDEPTYQALGDKMASRNGYKSEPSWMLYDTTGSTEDWSYWATGGYGFTFEIGTVGFHPPYEAGVIAEYAGLAPATGAGKGGNRQAFIDMLSNAADPAAHSTLIGSAPKGYQLQLRKSFQTPTSPVQQSDGTTLPPIYVTDTITSKLAATGGRFSWSVNPSTRPYIAGRYGRAPRGPAQANVVLPNPAGVPAINTNWPVDTTAERVPFHVDGMPKVDNGRFTVSIAWTNPATDWDMYILDSTGAIVTQSASGGTTSERAVLFDPPPGDYTAVLVNYAQADPTKTDDYANVSVDFASPLPTTLGPKEPYQLTCTDKKGRLVGLTDVYVDRAQTVDVGDVCTRSARLAKEHRR